MRSAECGIRLRVPYPAYLARFVPIPHSALRIPHWRCVVARGFFTDTTLCIGCKACEVACKQWNRLPADGYELTGDSYDNTGWLSGTTWRHVQFIEQFTPDRTTQARWLMMSDVCKHCVEAACLEVCPTGAIIRTEVDTVFIQPDVCNGCRGRIPA